MQNKYMSIGVVLPALLIFAGCASLAPQKHDPQVAPMQERISQLESEVSVKTAELNELASALERQQQEKEKLLAAFEAKKGIPADLSESLQEEYRASLEKSYYMSVIQLQMALRNSGFDPGIIDGKMGQSTRAALKEFQGANGLAADGILSRQTWEMLQEYLVPND